MKTKPKYNFGKVIVLCLMLCLLSSCALASMYKGYDYSFSATTGLNEHAVDLAEAYLEGQLEGESGMKASAKYGPGAVEFYGLKEYRYEGRNDQSVVYRIKSTNLAGAITWSTCGILFRKTDESEKYGGLVIKTVMELR